MALVGQEPAPPPAKPLPARFARDLSAASSFRTQGATFLSASQTVESPRITLTLTSARGLPDNFHPVGLALGMFSTNPAQRSPPRPRDAKAP